MFREGRFGSTKVKGVVGMLAVAVFESEETDPLVAVGVGPDLGEYVGEDRKGIIFGDWSMAR